MNNLYGEKTMGRRSFLSRTATMAGVTAVGEDGTDVAIEFDIGGERREYGKEDASCDGHGPGY